MTTTKNAASRPSPAPEWMPRIWEGCNFFAWTRLLVHNRFAIHFSYLHIAIIITFVSIFHSLLQWLQEALYGAEISRSRLPEDPIFIIGHWRTGTTLLHELLVLDDRHAYPTTYECLAPNHFLLSEKWITRWLSFLMPSHRPMDNMAAGWDRPQEDEFAMCMMGQPSPYLMIAFPNHPPQDQETLDLQKLSPQARHAWMQALLRFLKGVTYNRRKRLVLKSPTHSFRIKFLLELFPNARFIHIVRNPYVVFPSTVNLWKSLFKTHGLQRPDFAELEEYVFKTFIHLYEQLETGRQLVAPDRFYELRYEDLIQDPVGEMRKLYGHLDLGGFERLLPRLQQYLAASAGYQTNQYQLTPEVRAKIHTRWGEVIRRYRYEESAVVNR